MNRVTGPFSAIVSGEPTALAGCNGASKGCQMDCLRKDTVQNIMSEFVRDCVYFIPAKEVQS